MANRHNHLEHSIEICHNHMPHPSSSPMLPFFPFLFCLWVIGPRTHSDEDGQEPGACPNRGEVMTASLPKPYSILITDDDPACRQALRDIIEPEGYDTVLAESGEEALGHSGRLGRACIWRANAHAAIIIRWKAAFQFPSSLALIPANGPPRMC